MTKKEAEKTDSLEKKIIELHPEFLNRVRDVYPLGVLGSLSIAVAAFTAETYPGAQAYAITAASLFLVAFASSLLFTIISFDFLAFFSYLSTALAILFLFLVVIEFSKNTPMVVKSVFLILIGFGYLLISYAYFRFGRILKKTKSRSILLFGSFIVCLGYFSTATSSIVSVMYLFDVWSLDSFIPSLVITAAAISLFVSFAGMMILSLFILKEIRRAKRPLRDPVTIGAGS